MDNLDKQRKILSRIIGNKNKVQVYDRTTKSSKMVPKSSSTIKSANSSSNSSSFTKRKRGGCSGCSRKRLGG